MTTLDAPVRTAWSPRGWAIYLGWTMITVDGSALNLALPRIAEELRFHEGGIAWVVDAYALPLASLLLLGGSLGDRLGPERLFRIGAIGFAMTSAACALSSSMAVLIACRTAQGVSAALLLPMVLALVGTSFSNPAQRASAVNLMTVLGGTGMAVGPFLGGLLADLASWRAVFWLTVPFGMVAAAIVGPANQPRPRRSHRPVDVPGQVIGTAGLVALVAGLIEVGRSASPAPAGILIAGGTVLLATFVLVEQRVSAPMMPLEIFQTPGFTPAVVGGFAFQFGAYGLQFFLALHLQSAWGVSASTGGLLVISFAVGIVLTSTVVNPVLLARGTRQMVLAGSVAAGSGTLLLLGAAAPERWWVLVVAELIIGGGTGIYSTALNKIASSSPGADSAGLASGIYNTSRQVGQSVGVAVLGALAVADSRTGFVTAILLVAGCAGAVAATHLRTVPAVD